jgi:hypothetical protein
MKQTRTSSFRLGFAAIEPDRIDAGLRHIANGI